MPSANGNTPYAKEISWKLLRPAQVTSQGGATCKVLDDGSVLVSGTRPDTDTYTIQAETELEAITAIRLEALPDESLPRGRAGRGDDGGFVISKVQVLQEPIRAAENVKFVRIELPRHDWLTMAEVQVFRGDENVARGGTATQSSTAYEGFAKLAIDGSTNPHFSSGRSISHTAFNDHPWWEVELAQPTHVDRVVIWNEEGHPKRLTGGAHFAARPGAEVGMAAIHCCFHLTLLQRTQSTLDRLHKLPGPAPTASVGTSQHFTRLKTMMPKVAWVVAGAGRRAATRILTLGFEQPIAAEDRKSLRIVVDQQARIEGRGGQTLGHFRLLVTDVPDAATTATVPPSIREIVATGAGKADARSNGRDHQVLPLDSARVEKACRRAREYRATFKR